MKIDSNKSIRIISNFLTPESYNKTAFLDNHILETDENGKITEFHSAPRLFDRSGTIDLRKFIISPALIDTHAHVPQIEAIGKHEPNLLSWLNKHIYTVEQSFNDLNYAKQIADKFFTLARSAGTSTIVAYSSGDINPTHEIFKSALKHRVRIVAGNVLMDQNVPQSLIGNPMSILTGSMELCEQWNKYSNKADTEKDYNDGRNESTQKQNSIKDSYYAFTPRFAISCSEGLLQETAKLAKKYDAYIQTHLNESQLEIKDAIKNHPYAKTYTEIYQKSDLLGPKTLLAHCIHNTDEELQIIKDTESKIVHCPDSNLFLGSGRFQIEKIMDFDITIGLGSDVGAGTTLNMFRIMRSMLYMQLAHQKKVDINIPYYLATLGNAKVLGLQDMIGSIEVGKQAELLLIGIKNIDFGLKNNEASKDILSKLIFTEDYSMQLVN